MLSKILKRSSPNTNYPTKQQEIQYTIGNRMRQQLNIPLKRAAGLKWPQFIITECESEYGDEKRIGRD